MVQAIITAVPHLGDKSWAQGTPGMVYSPAVDLWSAGVVLFILLGGYPPFFDESEPALFNLIRKGSFQYDDPVWESVSAQCVPASSLGPPSHVDMQRSLVACMLSAAPVLWILFALAAVQCCML